MGKRNAVSFLAGAVIAAAAFQSGATTQPATKPIAGMPDAQAAKPYTPEFREWVNVVLHTIACGHYADHWVLPSMHRSQRGFYWKITIWHWPSAAEAAHELRKSVELSLGMQVLCWRRRGYGISLKDFIIQEIQEDGIRPENGETGRRRQDTGQESGSSARLRRGPKSGDIHEWERGQEPFRGREGRLVEVKGAPKASLGDVSDERGGP